MKRTSEFLKHFVQTVLTETGVRDFLLLITSAVPESKRAA